MPAYNVQLLGLDNSLLADDVKPAEEVPEGATPLKYTRAFGGTGQLNAVFPLALVPPEAQAGKCKARVKRGTEVVWTGRLWKVGVDLDQELVTVEGLGSWQEARRRYVDVDKNYPDPGTDQATIAAQLVSLFTPLTVGSTPATGILRSLDYCAKRRPNVGGSVEQLASAVDPIEFDVGPDEVFNIFYPKMGAELELELDTAVNVVALSWEDDATDSSTEITGAGQGGCDTEPLVVVSGDPSGLGVLQESVVYDSPIGDSVASVTAHAQGELALMQKPRFTARATLLSDATGSCVVWGAFGLADRCSLVVAKGPYDFTRRVRIVGIDVTVASPGNESVQVVLDTFKAA